MSDKPEELKLKLAATIFVGLMDRRNEPGYTDDSALGEAMRLAEVAMSTYTRPTKTEEELRELLTATCAAHRVCCNEEHDPGNGKISGYCVVCGVPWPCETAKRFIQAALTPQNKIK
jgi:hypothetical protein